MDVYDRMIRWDEGDLTYDEFIQTAQYLVDTGLAWNLPGRYGRTCADLIDSGEIDAPLYGRGEG